MGRAENLIRHVRTILAGREAVITSPPQRDKGMPTLAWGRHGPVWRIRAGLTRLARPSPATPLTRDFVGHGAAPAGVPALLRLLAHDDPRERATAINALGTMGPAARAAATALRRSLNDPDMHVRLLRRRRPVANPTDGEGRDITIPASACP